MISDVIEALGDTKRNMESGVFDFTKDGKCVGCGMCCSDFLPISSKEIKQIKWHIQKNHIKEQRHNFPVLGIDLTCPFLDDSQEKSKCTIYEVRPEVCRSFVCNDPHGAQKNKKLLHKKYRPVDMREVFFGEK